MKKTSQLLLFAVCVCLMGCAHSLAPGGAYNGDKTVYDADVAVAAADTVFTTFVSWEHQNRAALAAVPEIRKLSASINDNAKNWERTYFALRDAYVANPSTTNKTAFLQALAVIQAALTQATGYLSTSTAAAPAK